MNAKQLFQVLKNQAIFTAENDEVEAVIVYLLERRIGLRREDILAAMPVAPDMDALMADVRRLNDFQPVQYVVGEAWFYHRLFLARPGALIPRADSEELIRLALRENFLPAPRILDIGTGSGCLAVTLALEISQAQVYAIDISPEALAVAAANAHRLGSRVAFSQLDFLAQVPNDPPYDMIVSNPPYLDPNQKAQTPEHIARYEPAIALWPPGRNQFLFYERLAQCIDYLNSGGKIIAELPTLSARQQDEICALFIQSGFSSVYVSKDIQPCVVAKK